MRVQRDAHFQDIFSVHYIAFPACVVLKKKKKKGRKGGKSCSWDKEEKKDQDDDDRVVWFSPLFKVFLVYIKMATNICD